MNYAQLKKHFEQLGADACSGSFPYAPTRPHEALFSAAKFLDARLTITQSRQLKDAVDHLYMRGERVGEEKQKAREAARNAENVEKLADARAREILQSVVDNWDDLR